mgnify:CR=1 FL=1
MNGATQMKRYLLVGMLFTMTVLCGIVAWPRLVGARRDANIRQRQTELHRVVARVYSVLGSHPDSSDGALVEAARSVASSDLGAQIDGSACRLNPQIGLWRGTEKTDNLDLAAAYGVGSIDSDGKFGFVGVTFGGLSVRVKALPAWYEDGIVIKK